MDNLDRAFYGYLGELEKSYLYLMKSLRLRVEKWIEKLTLDCQSNSVWRKHRNMYTRLLLGMVISKDLRSPFDKPPPDGQLPPFPSHLKAQLKGIQGPHESVFWRDLYASLPTNPDIMQATSSGQRLRLLTSREGKENMTKNETHIK